MTPSFYPSSSTSRHGATVLLLVLCLAVCSEGFVVSIGGRMQRFSALRMEADDVNGESTASSTAAPKATSPKPFVVAKRKSKTASGDVRPNPAAAAAAAAAAEVAAAEAKKEEEAKDESSPKVVVKRKSKKRNVELLAMWEAGQDAFFTEVEVKNFDKASKHCIIVSRKFINELIEYGGEGMNAEICDAGTVARCCMLFLMQQGMSVDNTEGMIDASIFPINYFEASQIRHFYPDYKLDLLKLIKEEGRKLPSNLAP